MQKIIDGLKLDFDDILISPKRSILTSRADIQLERTLKFYHSPREWSGIPIMCSNMSFCGVEMARKLAEHRMIACLHKYHTVQELHDYFLWYPDNIDYTFVSIGYKKGDLDNLLELSGLLGKQPNICIDVPNGQMDVFVKYCERVREHFPESIILAGNITNTSSTEELIIYGGVDIVKCGIGGGSACTTRFMTGCFAAGTKINTELGYKNIENIEPGDKVLTHDGSYQKVVKTHNNGKSEKLIEINGITCTKDHLFYVIEKNIANLINDDNIHEHAYWLEAIKISENKHYIIEIIQ